MRAAAAPLQVKLGGGARMELSLPAFVCNTHIPGWDVAKSYFLECKPGGLTTVMDRGKNEKEIRK